MKNNQSTRIKYKVMRASREQIDLVSDIFWKNTENWQIKKYEFIVFVAVDENENIIGYINIAEKVVPAPINRKYWWMNILKVLPEYRRQGIGTALVNEVIKQAKQADILHLQASCTNTPAHMFWLKQNFCFIKYHGIIDNPSNPFEHGNYPHMIFYRLNKSENKNVEKHDNFKIVKADKEQLDWFFDEYLINKCNKFYHNKKDIIFGLKAIDKDDNIVGFITAYEDEVGTPLDRKQWIIIPYIYVYDMHLQGVDIALINEMIKAAKEANVMQLLCTSDDNELSKFCYKNNFDIYFWGINPNTGKHSATAALRIL